MESCVSTGASTDWFTATHWSVVFSAGQGDADTARAALERLCQTYWYPLYAFVRRQGYSSDDAQDSTQAFFERMLAQPEDYFGNLNPARGRFRAFLLASLKHFLSDQRDRQRALRRGGDKVILSLDAHDAEQRYLLEPVNPVTPETLFERRWALTVLENARCRLQAEFASSGKRDLYEELKGCETGLSQDRTYAKIGRHLGLSESAVKSAVLRLRRRYGELIREEIAQTVTTASEIEDEIRHLLQVLTT